MAQLLKKIVTAGAKGADVDVLACVVAYAELLRLEGFEALPVVTGTFTMSVTPSIQTWDFAFETQHEDAADQEYILVDISDPNHAPHFVSEERVVEVYDHRHGHEDYWEERLGDRTHIELVGACGTLIWEEYKKRGKDALISDSSAKLLLASIVSNTLNFNAPITHTRDQLAYKELSAKTGLGDQWITDYFIEQEETLLNDFERYTETDTKMFSTRFGNVAIGQLELWDAYDILTKKKDEILHVMEKYADIPWMVNIPNISKGFNYIYSESKEGKRIVEEVLGIRFEGDTASTEGLMMRKQIMKALL